MHRDLVEMLNKFSWRKALGRMQSHVALDVRTKRQKILSIL